MTQRRQRRSHVTGAATGFHRHNAWRQTARESNHGVRAHPPSDDNLATFVQSDNAAAVLAQIDAEDQ
jgi:hypothetical protein